MLTSTPSAAACTPLYHGPIGTLAGWGCGGVWPEPWQGRAQGSARTHLVCARSLPTLRRQPLAVPQVQGGEAVEGPEVGGAVDPLDRASTQRQGLHGGGRSRAGPQHSGSRPAGGGSSYGAIGAIGGDWDDWGSGSSCEAIGAPFGVVLHRPAVRRAFPPTLFGRGTASNSLHELQAVCPRLTVCPDCKQLAHAWTRTSHTHAPGSSCEATRTHPPTYRSAGPAPPDRTCKPVSDSSTAAASGSRPHATSCRVTRDTASAGNGAAAASPATACQCV